MPSILALLSGTGGTGKTTLTSAMGASLTRSGKRALVVDMCAGTRGLDMALGLESRVMFDLGDLLDGSCDIRQAIISDSARNCPDMIAAPTDYRELDVCLLADLLEELRRSYEWIALDTPPGDNAMAAALVADAAYIVTTPDNSSVRGAERIIAAVRSPGGPSPLVIVNRLIPEFVKTGAHLSPDAISQVLDARLIGVVPRDDALECAAALGLIPDPEADSPAFEAISSTAERTLGAPIPKRWDIARRGLFGKARIVEEDI